MHVSILGVSAEVLVHARIRHKRQSVWEALEACQARESASKLWRFRAASRDLVKERPPANVAHLDFVIFCRACAVQHHARLIKVIGEKLQIRELGRRALTPPLK